MLDTLQRFENIIGSGSKTSFEISFASLHCLLCFTLKNESMIENVF